MLKRGWRRMCRRISLASRYRWSTNRRAPSAARLRSLVALAPPRVAQEQAMVFSIPPEKAAKWQASIEDVLRAGRLTPADAAKLAGKLGWGASAVFGRGARVYLAPLFHWSTGRRTILTTRLKRTLEWWQRFLAAAPQRNIPLRWRAKPRILVYSDATGGGRRRASRANFLACIRAARG